MSASGLLSAGDSGMVQGCSPGPVYYPKMCWYGLGPGGKGSEYTMRPSHRCSFDDKKTTQAERPGPKYMLPSSVGYQVESTKRSFNAGKFSACPRKTITMGPTRSPGPAAYDLTSIGLRTVAGNRRSVLPLKTGMGSAQRFFTEDQTAYPGPGEYKIPTAVGGYAPDKKSQPIAAFSKGERSTKLPEPNSPGPVYMVVPAIGPQVNSQLKSPAKYGFGTSSRFQCTSEENRRHIEALRVINPKTKLKNMA